jgi:hypothetical protein
VANGREAVEHSPSRAESRAGTVRVSHHQKKVEITIFWLLIPIAAGIAALWHGWRRRPWLVLADAAIVAVSFPAGGAIHDSSQSMCEPGGGCVQGLNASFGAVFGGIAGLIVGLMGLLALVVGRLLRARGAE